MKKKTIKLKMGRPTKYNDEMAKSICDDIRGGMTQEDAAMLNGISVQTLHSWKKSNLNFLESLQKAWRQFEHDNLLIIRQASVNLVSRDGNTMLRRGTWQASAWLLERRLHEKYAMKWSGEVSGRGGKPLIPEKPSVDLSRFSDAQLDAMAVNMSHIIKGPKTEAPHANGHSNGNGNGNGSSV